MDFYVFLVVENQMIFFYLAAHEEDLAIALGFEAIVVLF